MYKLYLDGQFFQSFNSISELAEGVYHLRNHSYAEVSAVASSELLQMIESITEAPVANEFDEGANWAAQQIRTKLLELVDMKNLLFNQE